MILLWLPISVILLQCMAKLPDGKLQTTSPKHPLGLRAWEAAGHKTNPLYRECMFGSVK